MKRYLSIGLVGPDHSGKTRLLAKLTGMDYQELNEPGSMSLYRISVPAAICRLEAEGCSIDLVDCHRELDFRKALVTGGIQLDGAILYQPTQEQLSLLALRGVTHTVNNDGSDGQVLLKQLQALIPTRPKPSSLPFYMPVEDSFTTPDQRGIAAAGRVSSGTLQAGDTAELVGLYDAPIPVLCEALIRYRRSVYALFPGDTAAVRLKGGDNARRGMALVSPGSVAPVKSFRALVYLYEPTERGLGIPLENKKYIQYYLGCTIFPGSVEVETDSGAAFPGQFVMIRGELNEPAPLRQFDTVMVEESQRPLGAGFVIL